jgi:DUF1009 family protein
MTTPSRPVGLIAGSGRFPLTFLHKAATIGLPVVTIGITYEADPALADLSHRFYWAGIAKMGRVIRLFKRDGVERIVMAGKITKSRWLFRPWRLLRALPDWRFLCWWFRRRSDNKDDTLLLSIIAEFARDGLHFDSALNLCPELLVPAGPLTRRKPTAAELRDVAFGWHLAREMGRLDVGQSVAVKDRAVLAVEAVEGTDQAIQRAGSLCRSGGFTVVKVAKPQQDMRFDVPTVGTSTIETLYEAGGRVLAIEADRTIVLDQEETVRLADRYGLSIVALNEPPAGA